MDYKILINKNAVPVLIEASDNSDPDTWFSLDDESRHIQFKDKESEVSARDLCYESQCPTPTNCTNISCDCKLRIGQTFPLPTGYKVSFEDDCTLNECNCPNPAKEGHVKLAILSKLEEEKCHTCGNTYKSSDPIFCSNSFHLVAPSEEVKQRKSELKETMSKISEAIRNNKKNQPLTPEQIEGVIEWMNGWEQLKGTAIPIRFKEDFS